MFLLSSESVSGSLQELYSTEINRTSEKPVLHPSCSCSLRLSLFQRHWLKMILQSKEQTSQPCPLGASSCKQIFRNSLHVHLACKQHAFFSNAPAGLFIQGQTACLNLLSETNNLGFLSICILYAIIFSISIAIFTQ